MAPNYPLDKVRDFGTIAHIDAGKTTVTEGILYISGKYTRSVKCMKVKPLWTGWSRSVNAGITITSAATTAFWKDHRINIIVLRHVGFTVKLNVLFACLTAQLLFSTARWVLNHSLRLFGDKPTNTTFLECSSAIK